jgi:uncharacterized LabA/DUF88 family protein
MAVDAISISSKVDVIVLATGDGDFVPLVEYLKAHGVICEVAAFAESTNARLREVADAFMDLSAEPEQFLIGYRGRRKTEKEESEKPARRKGARRENPQKTVLRPESASRTKTLKILGKRETL